MEQAGLVVVENLAVTCADCSRWSEGEGRGALVARLAHQALGYGVLGVKGLEERAGGVGGPPDPLSQKLFATASNLIKVSHLDNCFVSQNNPTGCNKMRQIPSSFPPVLSGTAMATPHLSCLLFTENFPSERYFAKNYDKKELEPVKGISRKLDFLSPVCNRGTGGCQELFPL